MAVTTSCQLSILVWRLSSEGS